MTIETYNNKPWDSNTKEGFTELEFRSFIRKYVPEPKDGYVVLDFDLILRIYRVKGRDEEGSIRLFEIKEGDAEFKGGQKWTFRVINKLLTLGSNILEEKIGVKRYEGFYEIWCSTYHWFDPECKWAVNGILVTREQFIAFLKDDKGMFPEEIKPLWS